MMFPVPLTLYAVIAFALLVVGFGAGWRVNEWKESAAKVAAIEQARKLQEAERRRADEISTRFEKKLAGFRVVQKTFFNEVKHETQQTVYRDCVVPDTGRLLLDRAVTTANSASELDRPMPTASPPGAELNNGGAPGMVGGRGDNVWGVRWPAWLTSNPGKQ